GFDTGPGNTLLDTWVRLHLNSQYDDAGSWGSSGHCHQPLLREMLKDPYLQLAPPKSTGPEQFNLGWLDAILSRLPTLNPRDVQATLISFTASSIAQAIEREAGKCDRVIACGGGVHNDELMRQLREQLRGIPLDISTAQGIDPDQVEALAFAWLARQTLLGLPGNIPAVTGASGPKILGGIFPAAPGLKYSVKGGH
ncbi:MAG: anhydro-N-acetylmuramic acid kinase, partial [Gammaproteobacteria bacterium]